MANLARLSFDEKEIEKLSEDLGAVLDYAIKLEELDTSEVKPTEHVLKVQNVFREDVVKPSLSLDEVLANAPESEADCFVVPRVLE